MNNVNISSKDRYPIFSGIEQFRGNKYGHLNYAFIKQQIHEQKIDEFFHTDIESTRNRRSRLALGGAVLGVAAPLLAIAKKQNPKLKLNSREIYKKAINIEYGLKELLTVGVGGVIGGLAGGLLDKKESDKLNKIEEASFQVMNISFPAILVSSATKACSKVKALNNIPAKIVTSGLGIFLGANAAVMASNKLDDKFFDKYNKDPERKFRKKDFIVHIDDVLGTFVLAKFPFAEKLHVGKILPLIYTWSGYHVGES